MPRKTITDSLRDPDVLRTLAAADGIGSVAFGVGMMIAPRAFGRAFGLPLGRDLKLYWPVRGVGARDIAIGMGVWSAAVHRGNYRPWMLARALSDSLDTVSIALALRSGARGGRFLALGAFALLVAAFEFALYVLARNASVNGGQRD